jgi:hypothetical protein
MTPGSDTDGSLKEHISVSFSNLEHPLRDLPEIERKRIWAEATEAAEKEWTESLKALDELIRRCAPVELLTHFAYYDLLHHDLYGDKSEYEPAKQHNVELLQALFLTVPESEIVNETPTPRDKLDANRLLKTAGMAFMHKRIGRANPETIELVREKARVYTQTWRHSGDLDTVVRKLRDLFTPFDDDLESSRGVSFSQLIAIGESYTLAVQEKLNWCREGLSKVARASIADEMIDAFSKHFHLDDNYTQWFYNQVKTGDLTLDQLKPFLLGYSEVFFRDIFILDLVELVPKLPQPVNISKLAEALEQWCLPPGSLCGQNVEHLFLNNPVWTQPLMRLSQERYFWPIVLSFMSFGVELLERFFEENELLKRKYFQRRSSYLEERVSALTCQIAPGSTCYRNLKWTAEETGREYETDVLILVDRHALIVECKSGKIDPSARRGGDRLRHEIGRLIKEPTEQGWRFAELLKAAKEPLTIMYGEGTVATIDRQRILRITRLNVTLDSFGLLACDHKTLEEAGVVNEQIPAAVTMSLLDLDRLLYLVESPSERLHYLHRREQVEGIYQLVGDEMDLLAYYFSTAFTLWPVDTTTLLLFSGMSDELDPFFYNRATGGPRKVPRLKREKWWTDILGRAEELRFDGWTEVGFVLLCFPIELQQEYWELVSQLKIRIRTDPGSARDQDVVCASYPANKQNVAIGTLVVDRISREQLDIKSQIAVKELFRITQADSAVFMVISATAETYPYFRIGILLPPT